jgi:SpoVK/Ycf46/Vps4 family AAA+-type ATPase
LSYADISVGEFNVHFKDVCNSGDIEKELSGLIQLSIQRPQEYTSGVLKGNRIPAVLLYGPPGTGKTMVAKAVATESGCTTLEVSGAQVLQRYVGGSEKIIQTIFQLARDLQPCMVFLDEADSVFTRRTEKANSWERTIVNQFLHEWDKVVSGTETVFIIVATNRPQDIDDAVLWRLPRRIHMGLPGPRERFAILTHYLVDERYSGVDLEAIVERTQRYSGSDLKNLCIEAASAAVEEELLKPSTTEPGAPRPSRILTKDHFERALCTIRPSATDTMLIDIARFDAKYGSGTLVEVGKVGRVLSYIRPKFGKRQID